ncbi:MAG: zinc ABC transporter substrate-binding protein [Firmicutes bacterium HGW-Firmicutes-15]|nr:MAG: zinc ABC transporter substrate-binding protein [Firmicutes bacterium HGW-Firmicutes-15]
MQSILAKFLPVLLISLIILGGCGLSKSTNDQVSSNSSVSEKKITIVTSFYPIYISTINVTRDIPGVQVVNMTKPQTGCLHDYQLTPDDLKTLEKADVFVISGAGMEAFLDKVIKQQPNLKIIEASQGIKLLKNEKGEENPHVWVSISSNIAQVKNIAEQLGATDIINAPKYKSNSEEYVKKLETLNYKMHEALDGVKNKNIVTFHEAFPYFAQEFNLHIAAVVEREPGSEPSPQELKDTIKTIQDSEIKALFAEPQYSIKAAETIARETGAKVYTLDPVVTGDSTLNSYINIMEQNLTSLEDALK